MFVRIYIGCLMTILLEIVALLLLKEKNKKYYIYSIFINIGTNLSLNIFLLNILDVSLLLYYAVLMVLEIIVVVIEFILYFILIGQKKKALLYSFVLNMVSFGVGVLINIIEYYLF